MLYTRKGDKGTTKTLRGNERIPKDSLLTEALGAVDELNSYIGLCKVKASFDVVMIKEDKITISSILENVQQNLFIIQAELAGADKKLNQSKIDELENVIDSIEKQLLPITTFLISGGTELGALFDVARTIARRVERRIISVHIKEVSLNEFTLGYINRLSSLLYALARHSNYRAGVREVPPTYE